MDSIEFREVLVHFDSWIQSKDVSQGDPTSRRILMDTILFLETTVHGYSYTRSILLHT